ncbi:MAG: adenosylcobinamide-phosphate synthase CbiB [Nitrospira sp.]|nr:adenosylcobinamide-phosphate synthase CbiB [Nitrospira sp.]
MTGSELLLAAGVDAVAGDPQWFPHPVRAMGTVITWCDKNARKVCRYSYALRAYGVLLALGLPLGVFALSREAVTMAEGIAWWFGSLLSIAMGWTTLAGRDLWDHVREVRRRLEQGDLTGARHALTRIVGRDTERLSEEEVVRATIETTAESTNDGIIAPLFYLVVGGAPLALAYKAVNTMDSMIGHKDERYIDFGWASARLDDVANWIPARLSAVLILLAAGLVMGGGAPIRTGWHILWRDGGKHPSPNSGRPEAAMAGSLGIQLGGINYYDGVPHERPVIGTGTRWLVLMDLTIASRIMIVACLLGVILAVGTAWLV